MFAEQGGQRRIVTQLIDQAVKYCLSDLVIYFDHLEMQTLEPVVQMPLHLSEQLHALVERT